MKTMILFLLSIVLQVAAVPSGDSTTDSASKQPAVQSVNKPVQKETANKSVIQPAKNTVKAALPVERKNEKKAVSGILITITYLIILLIIILILIVILIRKTKRYKEIPTNHLITLLMAIVSGLFIANWLYGYKGFNDLASASNFGNMFDAVSALFSGLAFAGLIIAIHYQTKELSLQREELALTREVLRLQKEEMKLTTKEIKEQKEEMNAQGKTLYKQAFDSFFFNLINNLISIEEQFIYTDASNYSTKGKLYLKKIYDDMTSSYNKETDQYNKVFLVNYENHRSQIQGYIQNIFVILENIYNADIPKATYVKILKSSIYQYGMLILYYYGTSNFCSNNNFYLLEKYHMFEGIYDNDLLNLKHKSLYDSDMYETYKD